MSDTLTYDATKVWNGSSCVVPAICQPFGVTINGVAPGNTMPYYTASPVLYGNTCPGGTFTCNNGTISPYNAAIPYYQNCTVCAQGQIIQGGVCVNGIVNGSCMATHNGCYAGSSVDTADDANYFYWQCNGVGGGSTDYCSEVKPCANGAINPPTCTPKPTVNLTADNVKVSYNTGTTLRWTTANSPTSCTATIGWTGSKAVGGGNQATGNLTVAQTYRLQCSNAGGSSALDSVTVTPCGAAAPNWNGSACVTGPSATLTVPDCTIASGASTFEIKWAYSPFLQIQVGTIIM